MATLVAWNTLSLQQAKAQEAPSNVSYQIRLFDFRKRLSDTQEEALTPGLVADVYGGYHHEVEVARSAPESVNGKLVEMVAYVCITNYPSLQTWKSSHVYKTYWKAKVFTQVGNQLSNFTGEVPGVGYTRKKDCTAAVDPSSPIPSYHSTPGGWIDNWGIAFDQTVTINNKTYYIWIHGQDVECEHLGANPAAPPGTVRVMPVKLEVEACIRDTQRISEPHDPPPPSWLALSE